MTCLFRLAPAIFGLIIFAAAITPVQAQQEFPAPQGKGRVVVVVSGHDGAAAYTGFAAQIAQLGYDAVLFDANNIAGNESAALRAAIQQAQQMPHAIPDKDFRKAGPSADLRFANVRCRCRRQVGPVRRPLARPG